MALFMKQDFTPPVLSKKWIAIQLRPNVLLHSVSHIVSILESGLLFREDSAEVEQGAPSPAEVWTTAGGAAGGWLTRGERVVSVVAVCACAAAYPPRGLHRSTLAHVSTLCALPVLLRAWHRRAGRSGALTRLLARMRDYLTLARRAAACLKECKAMHKDLESVTSAVESTRALLCRQQGELAVLLARASSALLGNAPWLKADLLWDAVGVQEQDLLKIHHAFLVVQSSLLKHIAMAHFVPSRQAQKIYLNHNERIYWIHSVLIPHISEEFKLNHEALERMYRLLKNYGNLDLNIVKKPGFAINDSWLYSEVHNGVARSSLELKVLLGKCVNLDMFLDSCALNRQEIDLDVLNHDIEDLIEGISKCLSTMQASQLRLKKMQYKIGAKNGKGVENNNDACSLVPAESDVRILQIGDEEPESKDEVFYFIKTEDDETSVQMPADVTTEPGKKEKDNTRIVLSELKRKLVKREDLMRERERQALANTMPELKNNLPEFPRQMPTETVEKKGFISKLSVNRQRNPAKRRSNFKKDPKGKWKFVNTRRSYVLSPKAETCDKGTENFEAKLNLKSKLKTLLTVHPISRGKLQITKWLSSKMHSREPTTAERFNYKVESESSGLSDDFIEVDEVVLTHQAMNQAMSQTINQVINPVVNEATNQAVHQVTNHVHQATNQAINEASNQALNQATNQAVNEATNQAVTEATKQSLNQATNQAVNQATKYAVNEATNEDVNQATKSSKDESKNITYTKKDLELSPSSSETDWEHHKEQLELLKDIRRHRVTRKKNYQPKRGSVLEDEGLRPVEYSFGTGLAIASVLQIDRGNRPNFSQEEVFIGDGEVSEDSGNDGEA